MALHGKRRLTSGSALSLQLLVKNLQVGEGKMIPAGQYFSTGSSAAVELTAEEQAFALQMRVGSGPRLSVRGRTLQTLRVLKSLD